MHTRGGSLYPLSSSVHRLSKNEQACYWCPDTSSSPRLSPLTEPSTLLGGRGDSLSVSVPIDAVLPANVLNQRVLICSEPDPHDEREQLSAVDLCIRPTSNSYTRKAEISGEADEDQIEKDQQSGSFEGSQCGECISAATNNDHSKFQTPKIWSSSGYGDCEKTSPLQKGNSCAESESSRSAMWAKVKHEVVEKLIQEYIPILKQRLGVISCPAHQNKQHTKAATYTHGESSQSSSSQSGRKRSLNDEGSNSPDEDQGDNKRHRQRSRDNTASEFELEHLACPFYKRDPQRWRKEGACTGPGFPTINKLK